jgi:hypothetical protein
VKLVVLARSIASPLSGKAHYLHWGVIQISVTNFVIIVAMVLLFAAALVIPFPHSRSRSDASAGSVRTRSGGSDDAS